MIPKIFHRVWIGPENKESNIFWEKSKSIHPDWKHITYSQPLPDGFDIIKDVVFFSDNAAYQSDLIRLEALYKFGGFYVDADIEVYKSFNSFLDLDSPIVGWENRDNNSIGSAVMGSPAKNKYILEVLNYKIECIKRDSVDNTIEHVQTKEHFMPNLLNQMWSKNNNIIKMNRDTFFPYDFGEKEEKRYFDFSQNPNTYAAHHWNLSWLKEGMELIPPILHS